MNFSFCIRSITVAHAFVLDAQHRCAYPEGRGVYGAVYGTEGEAEYRFMNGEHCTVRAGELLLLSPSAAYTVHIPRVFRHYTVNFDIVQGSVPPAELSDGYCVLPAASELLHLFERAAALYKSPYAGSEMAAMSCLYEILSLAAAAMEADGAKESRRLRLSPAREYLCAHFTAEISNAALASLCDMSETNFRREWTRTFGTTPLAYRDELRLERAKERLLRENATVGEIALECGFEDESYFVRFFKKHVGITPGSYRKRFVIL